MDWIYFWTVLAQISIAVIILLVIVFIGTALIAAVRTGIRDQHPKRRKMDKSVMHSLRNSNPKDN